MEAILSVTFRYCECWGPLRSQDVQTDATVTVYVWVIDFCCEGDLLKRTQTQKKMSDEMAFKICF